MCVDHFRKNRVFICGVVGLFCMSAYPEVRAATASMAVPSQSFQEEQTDPAALARHAAARADYWRGIYWTAKGDARKAVAYWRKAAVAGDAAAEFNMGDACYAGQGIVRNHQQA
ncbi:Sel1 domain-containing protein repeat-containing protein, partial [Acidithiobacillus sp. GGI-221]